MSRDVQVSKKLSWLLRHGIEQEHLQMDSAGYVNLNNRNIRSLRVSLEELKDLVATNNKQRFSLVPVSQSASPHGNPSDATPEPTAATAAGGSDAGQTSHFDSANPKDYLIRANQGHSIAVDSESLLTKIDQSNMPTTCIHGTTHHAWTLIVSTGGLKRMTRQHVHFAAGLPAGFKSIAEAQAFSDSTSADANTVTAPVISGMRNSSTILIYLNMKKALEGGVKFWKSANDVILSEGDENGLIPLTYFDRVEDRTGGQGILVQDGQVLKEAPAAWASKGPGRGGGRSGGKKGQAPKQQGPKASSGSKTDPQEPQEG
ncbi:tRNA 2'-phosphotransferase-like protein [Elsinoe australis]|uniref:2'-phosphotransferase n=1 Tax=Elsinoe australis TaxID=40998 RepID=A0A4U7APK0_9PEZI|nr:tRNA 2'-phosphotransferase-like protein [Elsinoe australis]